MKYKVILFDADDTLFDFKKTEKQHVAAFLKRLDERGLNATVRRELGSDIDAACGQLRKKAAHIETDIN